MQYVWFKVESRGSKLDPAEEYDVHIFALNLKATKSPIHEHNASYMKCRNDDFFS